jgi:Protein of unknown function (DUF1579)
MATGEMHKMMESWNGEWNEKVKFWMEPDAPPMENESSAINTMILGGRYQQSVHKGSFSGMPFEGISTLGYDNVLKMFVSTWVDNMGSGIMYMEGTWDAKTKTIHFTGTGVNPETEKRMDVKETFRIVDDNTQELKMYMVVDGKDIQTMEIIFTRNK